MSSVLRMAVLAVAILAASVSVANTLKIGGTGIALGGMSRLGTAFEELNPGTNIIVLPSLGSSGGIKALLAGATDIGLSSRELNNAEREAGALTQIYAYTPLAVVTSPDSKIDGVTTQDLEAIYSGTMTHWPDGSLVRIVMRPASEPIQRFCALCRNRWRWLSIQPCNGRGSSAPRMTRKMPRPLRNCQAPSGWWLWVRLLQKAEC